MMAMGRQVELSEIAEVIRGVTFAKGEAFDDAFDDAVPILRAGNIGQELDTRNGLIWLPPDKVANVQLLRRGDIAICMSSGSQEVVGKTARLNHEWTGSVGAFCAIIRPNENEVESEYLTFFLQTNAFRSWTRQSSGANIKNIRKSELEAFRLNLPPIEEQRRIVDILNRAASIERLRRQASAHLRDFIPALFLKMFGDLIENPMGWPVEEVRSLVTDGARNGLSPSRTGSVRGRVLTLSAITRGAFDPTALKESTFDHVIPDDQTVKAGRFLLCRGNGNPDLVGRGHFPTVDMPGVAFPDTIIALEFRLDCVRPEFVEALWATRFIREQIERAAKTTAHTRSIRDRC